MVPQYTSDPITIQTFPLEPVNNGQIALPQAILETLSTNSDQPLIALQIGDIVVLTHRYPQFSEFATQFVDCMEQQQQSVETLLDGLQEERRSIWQEKME